jgi:hypothetical protein
VALNVLALLLRKWFRSACVTGVTVTVMVVVMVTMMMAVMATAMVMVVLMS